MKFLFLIILWLCVLRVLSQDINEEITKINSFYQKNSNFSVDVKFQYFQDIKSNTPLQEYGGKVKKNGKSQYFEIGSIYIIQTNDYYLQVDKDEKQIVMSPIIHYGEEEVTSTGDIPDISLLKGQCTRYSTKQFNTNENIITFEFKTGEYSKIELVYNKENYSINYLLFYPSEAYLKKEEEYVPGNQPCLKIFYKNFRAYQPDSEGGLSYEMFLVKTGKVYKPKNAYSNYQFINQMQ